MRPIFSIGSIRMSLAFAATALSRIESVDLIIGAASVNRSSSATFVFSVLGKPPSLEPRKTDPLSPLLWALTDPWRIKLIYHPDKTYLRIHVRGYIIFPISLFHPGQIRLKGQQSQGQVLCPPGRWEVYDISLSVIWLIIRESSRVYFDAGGICDGHAKVGIYKLKQASLFLHNFFQPKEN